MNLFLDLDAMPAALRENDAMRFEHHLHVKWSPHIPAVDERLVATAADQFGGALTTEAFDRGGCGYRGTNGRDGDRCGATYATHECETILAIRLKRNVQEAEIDAFVQAALAWLQENRVDGVGLLPSEEGFVVLDPSPEPKGYLARPNKGTLPNED